MQSPDSAHDTRADKLSRGNRGEVLQLTLDDAISAGQVGMAISIEAATRRDPAFSERAEVQIVRYLQQRGNKAPGEDITEAVCKAIGCRAQALGAVYKRLIGKRLRVTRTDLPRRHGHASLGGKEYELIA